VLRLVEILVEGVSRVDGLVFCGGVLALERRGWSARCFQGDAWRSGVWMQTTYSILENDFHATGVFWLDC